MVLAPKSPKFKNRKEAHMETEVSWLLKPEFKDQPIGWNEIEVFGPLICWGAYRCRYREFSESGWCTRNESIHLLFTGDAIVGDMVILQVGERMICYQLDALQERIPGCPFLYEAAELVGMDVTELIDDVFKLVPPRGHVAGAN